MDRLGPPLYPSGGKTMYVHIGGEVTVPADTISVLIDLESVLPSQKSVTQFINSEDERNRLEYITEEIPRPVVIGTDRTYMSPLSIGVLRKRIEKGLYVP